MIIKIKVDMPNMDHHNMVAAVVLVTIKVVPLVVHHLYKQVDHLMEDLPLCRDHLQTNHLRPRVNVKCVHAMSSS